MRGFKHTEQLFFSAINAKTLKVTFNKAIEDTAKATFEVKRGSIKVNVAEKTWNEGNDEVNLELSGKLTAGNYDVTISGLTEEDLIATIATENERVALVEILSEVAVLSDNDDTATVAYKAENQYGENISAIADILANAAGTVVDKGKDTAATKGIVTIPVVEDAKEGDTIVLTLVHAATGESDSKTVKVSSQAQIASIEIIGLYNKDDKALTEITNLSKDKFYVLVAGADQYGNPAKPVSFNKDNDVVITNTNPAVVGFGKEFTTLKVDGKDAIALPLEGSPTVGTTKLMLIAAASGKNATYEVEVAEAQRADTVELDVPELVAANEDTFIPIYVYDKEGNPITNADALNDDTRGVKVTGVKDGQITEDKKNEGVVGITISGQEDATKAGYISIVVVTATGKSAIANINVQKMAVPTVIRGLAQGVSQVIVNGGNDNGKLELNLTSLAVEDQYGRIMTNPSSFFAAGNGYQVDVAVDKDSEVLEIKAGNVINSKGNVILSAIANGTAKVSFTLQVKDGSDFKDVKGSEQEIEFRVTDGTEYAEYVVDDLGLMFDAAGAGLTDSTGKYDKPLKVYGVLDDGKKQALKDDAYSVDLLGYLEAKNGKITIKDSEDVPYADEKTTTHQVDITVTINATGEQIVKELTISKVAPKAVELKLVNKTTGNIATQAGFDQLKEEKTVTGVVYSSGQYETITANELVKFAVADNYGIFHVISNDESEFIDGIKLLAIPETAHSMDISDNNSWELNFKLNEGFDYDSKVTIKATVDGVSKSFIFIGKQE